MIKTFWEETIDALKDIGKTFDDVEWIGGDDFEISKENFERISNFIYDDGYGEQEVAEDIKLVGKDFMLIRWEYDGSEGWQYIKTKPTGIVREIDFLSKEDANKYYDDIDLNGYVFVPTLKSLNQHRQGENK